MKKIDEERDEYQPESKNGRNKGIVIKSIIGTVIIGSVIVCLTTGCFSEVNIQNKQSNVLATPVQVNKRTYDILTEDWNQAVFSLELGNKYEIEDRRNIKIIIKKLNNIFSNTMTVQAFQQQQHCTLANSNNIYLPSKLYLEYLQKNKIQDKIYFTKNDTEDDIIFKLKSITNTKYIGKDMLQKIAILSSFEYFFNINKKSFYKKGFSKHIKNFKLYEEAIKRCSIEK